MVSSSSTSVGTSHRTRWTVLELIIHSAQRGLGQRFQRVYLAGRQVEDEGLVERTGGGGLGGRT